MTDHLCPSCRFADWKRTANGRLHPDGYGMCLWTPPHIPTPAVWGWPLSSTSRQPPRPMGGTIGRNPVTPITTCETWEKKDD